MYFAYIYIYIYIYIYPEIKRNHNPIKTIATIKAKKTALTIIRPPEDDYDVWNTCREKFKKKENIY